jgi:hypothetical protein
MFKEESGSYILFRLERRITVFKHVIEGLDSQLTNSYGKNRDQYMALKGVRCQLSPRKNDLAVKSIQR